VPPRLELSISYQNVPLCGLLLHGICMSRNSNAWPAISVINEYLNVPKCLPVRFSFHALSLYQNRAVICFVSLWFFQSSGWVESLLLGVHPSHCPLMAFSKLVCPMCSYLKKWWKISMLVTMLVMHYWRNVVEVPSGLCFLLTSADRIGIHLEARNMQHQSSNNVSIQLSKS
jgi:hypothetical protein